MKNLTGYADKTHMEECLDEVQMVSYVLQIYSDKEHQEIENHLNRCQRCFNETVSLVRVQREIRDETKWINHQEFSTWKEIIRNKCLIILQVINEKWGLIRTTGKILKPSVVVRGSKDSEKRDIGSKNLPTLVETFNGYKVEVNIEESQIKDITIYLRVKKVKDETLVHHVTFTLVDEHGQKILTELTRDGFISLEGLKHGEYSIKMVQFEKLIGTITLDLRGN